MCGLRTFFWLIGICLFDWAKVDCGSRLFFIVKGFYFSVFLHRNHSAESSVLVGDDCDASVVEHFHFQCSLWEEGSGAGVCLDVEHNGVVFAVSYFSFVERHESRVVVNSFDMLFVFVESIRASCFYLIIAWGSHTFRPVQEFE